MAHSINALIGSLSRAIDRTGKMYNAKESIKQLEEELLKELRARFEHRYDIQTEIDGSIRDLWCKPALTPWDKSVRTGKLREAQKIITPHDTPIEIAIAERQACTP